MSWHFIERWLQKVNQHSTLVGKFWITFLIVFRIVVVSSIGDRVYSDEQSEFKCNTGQIIMVCTPSIIFMVYSAHHTKRKGGKEKAASHNSPISPEKNRKPEDALAAAASQLKNCPSDEDNNKKKKRKKFDGGIGPHDQPKKAKKKDGEDGKWGTTEHRGLYAVTVFLRTMLEILFIILQYRLFGWSIPSLYKCEGFPCPNKVDCFVSRPMEKTIFLWFMSIIAGISLVLNVVEMYYMLLKWATKGSQCCSEKKKSLREMGSLTIHDAQILERGIVEPLNDPPDYGRIRDDFDQEQFMPAMAYMKNPPMAISVSLDQALAEQVGNHPSAKLIGPTAPLRGRDLLVSNPSLDRSYANLKRPDQRDMKNPKKGNDYYDYV